MGIIFILELAQDILVPEIQNPNLLPGSKKGIKHECLLPFNGMQILLLEAATLLCVMVGLAKVTNDTIIIILLFLSLQRTLYTVPCFSNH